MKNISIFIIFILIIFTGCTSDFKVDEDTVKDISDKITKTVIEKVGTERVEKGETHKLDASNLNELIVNNAVGDINITGQESTEAIIDVTIKANSNSKEGAEKLLEDYNYSVESKLKAIVVDMTEYKENLKNNDGISVDLNIKIPTTIKKITITSNVGDINIENIYGEFKAATNVGDIKINNSDASYNIKLDVGKVTIKNSKIVGKTEFNTNTGDINIEAIDISESKNITAETQVGDITMSLPGSSSYKAEINEFMEKEKTEIKGSGKTYIKLVTNVGNIDFK